MSSTLGTPTLAALVDLELLGLERREQAAWTTRIPDWHPRAEGEGGAGEGGAGEGGAGGAGEGGSGEGGAGGAGGEEWTPPSREEYEAITRERDEARRSAAKADKARRERERAAAQQAGNFEELYKEEHGRVEKVTGLVRTNTITSGVHAVAERLGFNTPSIAARLIETGDLTVEVDLDADTFPELDSAAQTLIERRLTEVAQREPGLLRSGPGRMLPGAGQGGQGAGGSGNDAMNAMIRAGAGRGGR
jgi:hypothetical protein